MLEPGFEVFRDIELFCYECGAQFIWTAGEQKFYRNKELRMPKRCPKCRAIRKAAIMPEVKND